MTGFIILKIISLSLLFIQINYKPSSLSFKVDRIVKDNPQNFEKQTTKRCSF